MRAVVSTRDPQRKGSLGLLFLSRAATTHDRARQGRSSKSSMAHGPNGRAVPILRGWLHGALLIRLQSPSLAFTGPTLLIGCLQTAASNASRIGGSFHQTIIAASPFHSILIAYLASYGSLTNTLRQGPSECPSAFLTPFSQILEALRGQSYTNGPSSFPA